LFSRAFRQEADVQHDTADDDAPAIRAFYRTRIPSAFRDWASERTTFAREICEAALAHIVTDKTEAAYRRGDLFEKRRELMAAWANFLCSADAKIIPLRVPA
jgi:hypothetical protein